MSLEAKIDKASDFYWKLKAIDSLQFPSTEERNKVMSILIDNPDILNALLEYERNFSSRLLRSQRSKTETELVAVPNMV